MKVILFLSIFTLSLTQIADASLIGTALKSAKDYLTPKPKISIRKFSYGKIKESNMHLLPVHKTSSREHGEILTELDDKLAEANYRFLDVEKSIKENLILRGDALQERILELNQLNLLIAHNHAVIRMGNENTITKEAVREHINIMKKSISLQYSLQGKYSSAMFRNGTMNLHQAYMDIGNLRSMYNLNQ
jgi:hypothetical protein